MLDHIFSKYFYFERGKGMLISNTRSEERSSNVKKMKLNKLFSLLLALKLSSAQGKIELILNLQRKWLFEIKKEHYCCK